MFFVKSVFLAKLALKNSLGPTAIIVSKSKAKERIFDYYDILTSLNLNNSEYGINFAVEKY